MSFGQYRKDSQKQSPPPSSTSSSSEENLEAIEDPKLAIQDPKVEEVENPFGSLIIKDNMAEFEKLMEMFRVVQTNFATINTTLTQVTTNVTTLNNSISQLAVAQEQSTSGFMTALEKVKIECKVESGTGGAGAPHITSTTFPNLTIPKESEEAAMEAFTTYENTVRNQIKANPSYKKLEFSALAAGILSGLRGQVAVMCNTINSDDVATIDDLMKRMKAVVNPSNIPQKAMSMFKTCYQHEKDDILTYASKLKTLFDLAFPDQDNQSHSLLCQQFLLGLHNQKIQKKISERETATPTTLVDLRDLAITIQARMEEAETNLRSANVLRKSGVNAHHYKQGGQQKGITNTTRQQQQVRENTIGGTGHSPMDLSALERQRKRMGQQEGRTFMRSNSNKNPAVQSSQGQMAPKNGQSTQKQFTQKKVGFGQRGQSNANTTDTKFVKSEGKNNYNGKKNYTCYNCRKPGHLIADCPEPKRQMIGAMEEIFEEDEEDINDDEDFPPDFGEELIGAMDQEAPSQSQNLQ